MLNANVDKRAEIHDIADSSFQLHARLQVFHGEDVLPKKRCCHVLTKIATGILQAANDVMHCLNANAIIDKWRNINTSNLGNYFMIT